MRVKLLLIVGLFIILPAKFCAAQSTSTEQKVEWGQGVQGVRLSLIITNIVIEAGSTVRVAVVLTNGSTNSISVLFEVYAEGASDLEFTMANKEGTLYHFKPPLPSLNSVVNITLRPMGTRSLTIPVTFPSEIKPGDYKVKASRSFFPSVGPELEIESNSLEVRIKKHP
jgi:uncharacterized membrane protein